MTDVNALCRQRLFSKPYCTFQLRQRPFRYKASTKHKVLSLTTEFSSVLQQSLTAQVAFRKPLADCLDDAIKQVFQVKAKDEIKIIDAGAGTGLMAVELIKLGYTNLHALDISQEMLNEAKKKNLYKKIICAPLNDQHIAELKQENSMLWFVVVRYSKGSSALQLS